jgi:hypothetical protein
MKGTRWLLVLLLVWTLPAWADDARKQTFVVGADVNAQGAVTQTQVDPDVSKPIAAVLDLALKHWSFVPAQQEGKTVPVHTFVEVKFETIADATGKYTLTIRFVSQGPRWDKKFRPYYPKDAVNDRVEGNVAMVGELHGDGKPIITDSQTSVRGHPGQLLAQSAKDSVLHDPFFPELVDGKPVSARLRAFITFRLNVVNARSPQRGKGRFASGGYFGTSAPHSSDDAAAEDMDEAERNFMAKTGFDVGIGTDRSWRSGISSVLQPRVVNPVTMHL